MGEVGGLDGTFGTTEGVGDFAGGVGVLEWVGVTVGFGFFGCEGEGDGEGSFATLFFG